MVICEQCGMAYCPDVNSDRQQHDDHHDAVVNGVPLFPAADDRVINSLGDGVEVVYFDHTSRRRELAQLVVRLANLESQLGPVTPGLNWPEEFVVVARKEARAVGVIVVRRSYQVFKADWTLPPGTPAVSLPDHPPAWTVAYLSIHRSCRRTGLARKLVLVTAKFLGIHLSELAWEFPFSPDGRAFVQALRPREFLIG